MISSNVSKNMISSSNSSSLLCTSTTNNHATYEGDAGDEDEGLEDEDNEDENDGDDEDEDEGNADDEGEDDDADEDDEDDDEEEGGANHAISKGSRSNIALLTTKTQRRTRMTKATAITDAIVTCAFDGAVKRNCL